jgi:hypothetical protein
MAVHSFTLILDLDYASDEQMDAIAAARSMDPFLDPTARTRRTAATPNELRLR